MNPPLTNPRAIHTAKMSYDQHGNCIAWEYYGVDGQRCLTKRRLRQSDGRLRRARQPTQMGVLRLHNGNPAVDQSDGQSYGQESFTTQRGNCIAWEYYGVDGQRCLTKDGYAKVTADYDERGNRIKEAYFEETGNSTAKNGVARWTAKYDDGNYLADITYFDRDGKPTAAEIYIVEVLPGTQAEEAG